MYYQNASFTLFNIDELINWIELLPGEAQNHLMFMLVAYVVKDSPKFKILAYIAHLIRSVHHWRLWVFEDWPLTQWNVEMMLFCWVQYHKPMPFPDMVVDLEKEAISARLMWIWTEQRGTLSQARQEHQKEVENELMDFLLQIFDEFERYI